MASRRLDISSLLCDDQVPEPVVLAPHLRHSGQSSTPSYARHDPSPSLSPTFSPSSHILNSQRPSSSHSSRHHLSPPSTSHTLPPPTISTSHQFPSPGSSMPTKLPSFGLEALVQAATEERRRLSGGSSTESDLSRHQSSPRIEQRHVAQPQQFHHPQSFRQHKPADDYIRSPIQHRSPVLSPVQTIRSPVQPIRSSPAYSPLLQHHPQPRPHVAERHRVSLDESQIRLSPVDDLRYRPPQSTFFSSPPQSQPSRQQPELEHRMHQQQQHELQRQRQHHEQLLYQEQQQQLARGRQAINTERPALPPPHRGPSMPLQLEVPSPSHNRPPPIPSTATGGRKSDPGQLHSLVTPVQTDAVSSPSLHLRPEPMLAGEGSSYPNKKRRYSDSPIHSISADAKERLHREREKMEAGELGYGRPEPAVSASSSGPRRPGSGSGHARKHLGLVELITTDREGERIPISSGTLSAVEGGREAHRLFSPHGRRSPPGSQEGRARAARKSEEVEHTLLDRVSSVGPAQAKAPDKEEKKKLQSRLPTESAQIPEPGSPKTKSRPPAPPPPPPPLDKAREEDAHEWFLEHFDEYNAPSLKEHSPRGASPTLPVSALLPSGRSTSGSPAPNERTPTPSTMPEAAVALEQELEELVDPPKRVSKVEPDIDMDVDLAVTELVAETLETDDAKTEDIGMEVDVEDELLSLVDDRPSARRPVVKSATPGPSTAKSSTSVRAGSKLVRRASPSAMSAASAPSPAGFLSPVVAPSSTRPASERGSMPPPASVAPGRGKDKEEKHTERAGSANSTIPTTKKKKDASSKPAPKPKAHAAPAASTKPRAKPGPKPKPKQSDGSLSATAAKAKGAAGSKKPAASRSRSTSVMPSGSAGAEGGETKAEKQEEEEESEQEDDKLYCVCKTKYDEDRCMIACDRCDDWYHTQCVNMPELEVDLVDQFFCPPCIEKNPHLSLRTTYKRRCLYGLRHPDPSSPKACHRPARGAFSKYCSDECGVKYMQSRADAWAKKGGKKDKLWETVKEAEKREGVVICAEDPNPAKMEVDEVCKDEKEKALKQKQSKIDREIKRLNGLLENVVILREEIKKGMEGVIWREKLLELATERAEQVGECGWDQRLCFGDEEWADFGAGVLESYEEVKADGEAGAAEGEGEWWCPGKKTCDRHAGWQTVRYRDVCKEKEKKEDALSNLTTREREIRKRIEDILDPHGRKCNDSPGKSPLKASNAKLSNGHTRGKPNGDTTKKGKKRKAPS
ncbi:putative PHD-finger [Lyophyllum shimeji]|uniref:PHD-finger n=1 Tax=Lyophyllum shimeji TaxID=47721 RepID=A0A9P3UMC8_LYOSH|nr:putative PHD-finger [Lyophyllum shimeji]